MAKQNSFTEFASGQSDPMKNKWIGSEYQREWDNITFGNGANPNMSGGTQQQIDAWQKQRDDGYAALRTKMGISEPAPAANSPQSATSQRPAATVTANPNSGGGGMLSTSQQSKQPAGSTAAAGAQDPRAGMLSDWYQSYMAAQPGASGPPVALAGTTTWTPDASSTVQGQLKNVLDAGGPLMQRAETKAKQYAQNRGLLNSSIAATAGQTALYDAATPIASADANTFASAGQFNAGAANATSQFNASATNTVAQQIRQIEADAATQGRALTAQEQQQLRDIAAQKERQQAEFGQQTSVQQTDITAKLDQQMRQIQADAQTQGRQLTFQEQQQLRDLQAQKEMQAAGFTQQTALQEKDFAQQNKTQAADLASRYDLANMDVQSRAALQQADFANQQKLQAANAALQTGLAATDAAVKQSMQVYDAELKKAMQGLDNQSRLALATLDADNRMALAGVEAKYKTELQGSQSMAASYQSMVDGMSRIMVSPDLDKDAKQEAINKLRTLYSGALALQSDISGLELGTLLDDASNDGTPTPNPGAPAPTPAPAPPPFDGYGDWEKQGGY